MSVPLPSAAVSFGGIAIPQTDIIDLKVHLGCTNEVASFECLMVNFDKKYTETYPISVGMNGSISIGRGTSCPLVATVRVEEVICESTSTENYIRVKGRCWGERLFRRCVTKTYVNVKAEEVVKDLIDNYVSLSHTRDGIELIEDTDTTYGKLEYENTPVFEILQFIAETAEKNGVVGFDFRVEPDAKFAFFPRNSKTSAVSLSERVEVSQHRRDIHRVRNKITVYGAAEKASPSDLDSWTEDLTCDDGEWTAGSGTVSKDTSVKAVGNASIKTHAESLYYASCLFTLNTGKEVNCNHYTSFSFQVRRESSFNGNLDITLYDDDDKTAFKTVTIGAEKWFKLQFRTGRKNADEWAVDTGFDWSKIRKIRFDCWFSGTGTGSFWIDNLYFNHRRWEATREDATSQNDYGLRELIKVDEELHSDGECDLQAKALLEYLKDPAEYLTVKSTVIDYGNTPILPGDKIHITLPNENVDGDYRVASVEYHVNNNQILEITLELGKEPALLSKVIYTLRKETRSLARYKAGPTGTAGTTSSAGGMQQHGNEWHTPDFAEEVHTHVEADITDLDHDAQKIKGKPVDDSSIGDNRILVYKVASDSLVYEDKPAGGGGAHADTHCCGGSDPITGVICPSGLKHPDTYQIIMDKRGTNVPCLRPQYDGYGDLGKPTYKWAYIYADYLGTSTDRITNAYLNNLRVYSNANFLCSLMTRDILVDGGYSIQLPRSYGAHGYIQPASAGYSYVGTSTLYLKEMHAKDFVTHSFKPISGGALEKLLKINLKDKLTFPKDCLSLPDKPHDNENVRRKLRDELKREPSEAEIAEELAKPEYQGVNLVQLCAYLVEAIKELETQLQAIREESS